MNAAQPITYIIQRGDTLRHIANLYNTTEAMILSANPWVDTCCLKPGMSLVIYPGRGYFRQPYGHYYPGFSESPGNHYPRPGAKVSPYPPGNPMYNNPSHYPGHLYTSDGSNTGFAAPLDRQSSNLENNTRFTGEEITPDLDLAMNPGFISPNQNAEFDQKTSFASPSNQQSYMEKNPGFSSPPCCKGMGSYMNPGFIRSF